MIPALATVLVSVMATLVHGVALAAPPYLPCLPPGDYLALYADLNAWGEN